MNDHNEIAFQERQTRSKSRAMIFAITSMVCLIMAALFAPVVHAAGENSEWKEGLTPCAQLAALSNATVNMRAQLYREDYYSSHWNDIRAQFAIAFVRLHVDLPDNVVQYMLGDWLDTMWLRASPQFLHNDTRLKDFAAAIAADCKANNGNKDADGMIEALYTHLADVAG